MDWTGSGPYKKLGFDISSVKPLDINLLLGIMTKVKLNSMVWVREQTIPTEQQPLVGQVSTNFWG
jgi:hypothetical protein